MPTTLKPIETVYGGYRFRSRLEARWAVFFDTLGIPFEYEKEGYDLGDAGWYLPDFWLPQHQYWIEIKGARPKDDEIAKAYALYKCTGYPVIIFCGLPGEPATFNIRFDMTDSSAGEGSDDFVVWSVCGGCGRVDLRLGDDRRYIFNPGDMHMIPNCFSGSDSCSKKARPPKHCHERVLAAEIKAKQARFEHH